MKEFVRIISLFKEDRTLDFLRTFYSDYTNLTSLIDDLTYDIICPKNINGKKVLLKPNWVRHSNSVSDEDCLRTNDSFILAALLTVLKQNPLKVTIGDAPIQGCQWNRMISSYFKDEVSNLSNQFGIPIIIKDFRRVTFNPSENILTNERIPLSEFIIFDLGSESALESITLDGKTKFRVNDYDPDRLIESHSPGVHKYCITRELFDADIILSLPKVKTHQKSGITAALKNLVGLNGDKDFLPHHRIGGKDVGGDCYPGKSKLKYLAELSLDEANRNRGSYKYTYWRKIASLLWRISLPNKFQNLGAAWYGNDTTWRMVIDLNRIVEYGNSDGSLNPSPIRRIYSLCDGIIGGQGNGPLFPDPLPLGIISFSNNASLNDLCMVSLMGFDFEKIPLLKFVAKDFDLTCLELSLNQAKINYEHLEKISLKTTPPPGWVGYI